MSVKGASESGTYEVEQSDKATYQYKERDGKWYLGSMPVEPSEGFRAKEIQLISLARPHMRAFHFAWSSFFVRRGVRSSRLELHMVANASRFRSAPSSAGSRLLR